MIAETSGICTSCKKGAHDGCQQVVARDNTGPVFCTCFCTGNTSLGNILYMGTVPDEVRDEFPELEDPENPDPLGHVFP